MSDSRAKYQQMLIDLRSDLRPQRDWGEGRGVLLGVASAAGDFFMKYSTIRAGVHLPLLTRAGAR